VRAKKPEWTSIFECKDDGTADPLDDVTAVWYDGYSHVIAGVTREDLERRRNGQAIAVAKAKAKAARNGRGTGRGKGRGKGKKAKAKGKAKTTSKSLVSEANSVTDTLPSGVAPNG
jgi:hypothetical protein